MALTNYSRISKYKFVFAILVSFFMILSVPSFAKAEDNRGREENNRESRNDDRDNDHNEEDEHERDEDDKKDNRRCKRNREHKEKCEAKEVPEFSTITGLLTAGLSSGGLLFLKKRPF